MSEINVGSGDALVVVDLQVDFCPGGALGVSEGDRVVPLINRLLAIPVWFKVGTRDWHPADHVSFTGQGGTWPVHCVADSPGAQFHPDLDSARFDLVISKAMRSDAEAYSGFDGTSLADDLRQKGVQRLFVCGLATDFCVRATALDGRKEGFDVVVLEDAIRAVNLKPEDGERACQEMREAGCTFSRSEDIQA